MNTTYYDKEDALILALNYKNPQGRILRRQWTCRLKGIPSYQDWRIIKEEMVMPAEFLNIPSTNLSIIR